MSTQELEVFIRTHAGVKSIKEMARETFKAPSRITALASNLKICLRNKDQLQKREELEKAIRENHRKMTAQQVAALVNQPLSTVVSRAWKMDLKFKVTKIYKSREEKAYAPKFINNGPTGRYLKERDMDMWWTAGYERTA